MLSAKQDPYMGGDMISSPKIWVNPWRPDSLLAWTLHFPGVMNTIAGRKSMPQQIGYAVLGAGDMTRHGLLPAFAATTGNTRLSAIVAGDRAEAQALAQEFSAAAAHP